MIFEKDDEIKNKNEDILIGKFTEKLKGPDNGSWGFFKFKKDNSREQVMIYCSGLEMPELNKKYEVTIVKAQRNFKLVKYIPVKIEIDINSEINTHLNKIPSVGKATSKKILDAFGKDVIKVFFDESKAIEILKIIPKNTYEKILSYFKKNEKQMLKINNLINQNTKEYQDNIQFFFGNDLQKIFTLLTKIHENDSNPNFIELYKSKNPYDLWEKYDIPINEIDTFALLLGYQTLSKQRIYAYIDYAMFNLEENNSTFININDLIISVIKFANLSSSIEIKEVINGFIISKIKDGTLFAKENSVSRIEMREKEKFIIDKINFINQNSVLILQKEPQEELKYLSDDQKLAYEMISNCGVSIISGMPGTGKSLIIKHIYNTLKLNDFKEENDFYILAPTGRAASNISSKHGIPTRTIHSFLRIKNDKEDVSTDIDFNDIKILVIDEFSMVNINIFHKILKSCSNLQKLILIGDSNQLPAIGPGIILNDLIESGKIPCVFLNKIYRSDSEEIKNYINFINALGDSKNPYFMDFFKFFINKKLAEFISDREIIEYYKQKLLLNPENTYKEFVYNFSDSWIEYIAKGFTGNQVNVWNSKKPFDDLSSLFIEKVNKYGIFNTVVLCPIYRGGFGINLINKAIQNKYNPNGDVVHTSKINGEVVEYKVGDKVIQLVNKNEIGVSNGDLGVISSVRENKVEKEIFVKFRIGEKNLEVKYNKEDFSAEINLAYAITVHKFQGSENDSVIFVVYKEHSGMLNRKLVYTAVSRAKKDLTIFALNENIYSSIFINRFSKKEQKVTNMQEFLGLEE
ncbi:ATP-dependent DNA helicase [Mycoplasma sp. CSL7503-lung]|uniref:ATP-dependent DNA helicase n=1 Tax=Mycoplasma sp. CSL7503-lung TaxID=536372 RepID=UPI0021D0430C|nr:AAA family ATPase [Mycoplasma sp. CSL7503-lung]MCU4706734.1 AAA family ATPase [Mycoplasma sp. CSL7503-lung]